MKFWLVTNLDNNKKILTKDHMDAVLILTQYQNCKMEEVELYLKPKPVEPMNIETILS
jgi:hypothetical protein